MLHKATHFDYEDEDDDDDDFIKTALLTPDPPEAEHLTPER